MRTTSRVVSGCLALLATLVTNCLRQVYGRTLTIMLTSKYCISFNIKKWLCAYTCIFYTGE